MPTDPSINGRPIQWNDIPNRGRKIVSDNIREMGQNLPKIAAERAAHFEEAATRGGATAAKNKVVATSLNNVQPHLESKPVTLQTAANARQKLYNRGIQDRAQQNPHDEHQVIPTGAGWYFEHHKAIASEADKHGIPHDWAIAASGAMSPQNSPENERASVSAIMDAMANHKVHVTPEVHEHLGKQGIDVTEHLNKTVHMDSLPVGSIAHLSTSSIRDSVPTTANLHQVARGGTKGNITKAEKILTGEIAPHEAMDPHSAPKVWSYIHNTTQAVPNSATHVEYMGRVHQDALVRRGQISPHQGALDLYGHGEKTGSHLLSPESHTVEDTWQNAATFDQPKTMVGTGRTSVFKSAGSMDVTYPMAGVKTRVNEETGKRETAHADARVSKTSITHAFNNRATQKAAEQQSRGSGVTVPPVAVQEVGWVQMRKDAGKDPEWNQRTVEKPQEHREIPGQQALFGDHVPSPSVSRAPEHGLTPDQEQREYAKAAAIHSNRMKKKFRQDAHARLLNGGQF